MWGLSWKPLSLKNNIDFRLGRQVEEDLVTTNLIIDKSWSVNMRFGKISLDWPNPLVECVGRHFGMLYPNNVSNHMIWMIWFFHNFWKDQTRQISRINEGSKLFHITRDLGVYGVSTIQCRLGNGYGCVAWRRWQTWTGLRRWQLKYGFADDI